MPTKQTGTSLREVTDRLQAQLNESSAAHADAARPLPSKFNWTAADAQAYQGIFTKWVQDVRLPQQQKNTYVRFWRSQHYHNIGRARNVRSTAMHLISCASGVCNLRASMCCSIVGA